MTSIIDPPGGIFKFDPSFRDYFLTLLLNAIHVAIESPSLRSRVFEQRQRLKSEELKKLLQDLTSFPSFEQIFNLETINSLSDLRLNSRTESFVNIPSSTLNSTTTNNENLPSTSNTNSTGRISPVTTKKGRISRLFDVFTTKTTNPPVITTPIPPPPAAVPVVVEKEPIKRKASVVRREERKEEKMTTFFLSFHLEIDTRASSTNNDNTSCFNTSTNSINSKYSGNARWKFISNSS